MPGEADSKMPASGQGSASPSDALIAHEDARERSLYYHAADASEEKRLDEQQAILRAFDNPVYDELFASKSDLTLLDIGCSDGRLLYDRFSPRSEITHILGIDIDAAALERARKRCGSDRISFQCVDCQLTQDFAACCEAYLHAHNRAGFDFVNMSFVVHHLKAPLDALKVVREHMNPGGVIFIRDVEDGGKYAYPDPNGYFERAIKIAGYGGDLAGYRKSGRQTYGMLLEAGFSDVRLAASGFSTAGMDRATRRIAFTVYFKWILGNIENLCRAYPDNAHYKEEKEWLSAHYDRMGEAFLDEQFFFNTGDLIFTATA